MLEGVILSVIRCSSKAFCKPESNGVRRRKKHRRFPIGFESLASTGAKVFPGGVRQEPTALAHRSQKSARLGAVDPSLLHTPPQEPHCAEHPFSSNNIGRHFARSAIVAADVMVGFRCNRNAFSLTGTQAVLIEESEEAAGVDLIVIEKIQHTSLLEFKNDARTRWAGLVDHCRDKPPFNIVKTACEFEGAGIDQINY